MSYIQQQQNELKGQMGFQILQVALRYKCHFEFIQLNKFAMKGHGGITDIMLSTHVFVVWYQYTNTGLCTCLHMFLEKCFSFP